MLSEKIVSQVNLVIPPVVNRLISVRELRAVAIKHLVELSFEHEFFGHFFSKRKTCHGYSATLGEFEKSIVLKLKKSEKANKIP